MGFRAICIVLVAVFLLSLSTASFAAAKKELKSEILAQQMDQKRQAFMKEQKEIRSQVTQLRKAWFKQRADLYAKSKANPNDQAIKDEINQAKKDFYDNKVALYQQLHQLRTAWVEERRDIFDEIRAAKKNELD